MNRKSLWDKDIKRDYVRTAVQCVGFKLSVITRESKVKIVYKKVTVS